MSTQYGSQSDKSTVLDKPVLDSFTAQHLASMSVLCLQGHYQIGGDELEGTTWTRNFVNLLKEMRGL